MDEKMRSGFVAVVGRPNVGKSTLVNALLGQKVAAVSATAQTTRQRQLAILTRPGIQMVLVDTPGIHKPVHRLGEFMNRVALLALEDPDVVLWLVDASVAPQEEDRLVAEQVNKLAARPFTLLALNKVDRLALSDRPSRLAEYQALLPSAETLFISAAGKEGLSELMEKLIAHLPEGEAFYDEEQVTDLYERDIAAELLREACLIHLRSEVPHAVAVRIDEYTDRSDTQAYVGATLFVEKESQKPIVIGKGGDMLKKIGSTARKEMEVMCGRKVFLELRVKVDKNWRSSVDALKRMGYNIDEI
jgi:GTP-binding protein Era